MALGSVALVSGCGASSPSAPDHSLSVTSGPDTPRSTSTNSLVNASPQDVCSDLGIASVAGDTSVDYGPADARRRAAQQYGTPALQQQWAGSGQDQQWDALKAAHARINATATPVGDDLPPAQNGQASAAATITPTATLPNGQHQPMTTFVIYCGLQQVNGAWRVTTVNLA
ncbi:hypothetical protein [Amycolatopsis sp. NPDC051903]|uniref:hypothetical protein n=1 Tax=Amycolatopsis sp. NPDC051903 TaxID=3363936 RepID=UPI0037992928